MSKKKKRIREYNSSDFHHFLYQKKHWQNGYAKLLREHPYMGKYIPKNSLHSLIHSKIHDIPVPNGRDCKRAYLKLLELERTGEIDVRLDSCEERLDFLIEVWKYSCPATVAVLMWQRDIISKFYEKESL